MGATRSIALPPAHLSRPRLVRLVAPTGTRVTCVVAGPGYGKSVLVREWEQAATQRVVAWIELARTLSRPTQLWRALGRASLEAASALGDRRPGRAGQRALRNPGALLSFLAGLEAGAPFGPAVTIVLDDYQLVTDRESHEGIGWLVEHLPDQVHLIVVARGDPPLPLSSWRLKGWLSEVRQRDLEYTRDEARQVLRRVSGTELGDETLDLLAERAERWPVGIQFAALALAEERDPISAVEAFVGSGSVVADYFLNAVLGTVSPSTRSFLLTTAVLETLTPEACRALTGREDAGAILADLAGRGLFTSQLEPAGRAFRYHRLFVELLRYELASTDRAALARAHRDAARFYETTGERCSALHHLFEAGDLDRAYQLLVEDRTSVVRDRGVGALRPWLDRLPASVFESDPSRALGYAEAIGADGRLEDALALLYQLPATRHWGEPAFKARASWSMAIAHAQLGELDPVRARLAAIRAEVPESLPEGPMAGQWGAIPLAAVVLDEWHLAEGEWRWGRRQGLDAVEGLLGPAGMEGTLAAHRGLVTSAAPSLGEAIERFERAGAPPAAAGTNLLRASAIVAAECGELDTALRLVEEARWSAAALDPRTVARVATEATAAEISRRAGEPRRALWLVAQALRRVEPHSLAPAVRSLLAEVEAHAAFDLGDRLALGQAAAQVLPPLPRALARARMLLLRNDVPAARMALLEAADLSAPGAAAPVRALEARLLLARAARSPEEAEEAVAEAIELANWTGLLGSLASHAPSLEQLVAIGGRELARRLEPFVQRRPTRSPGQLAEPLSEREREVLRLLPTELSNHELALELYVSLNTVKTHLKTIYRKLGAQGRSDAVHRARELRLLPPRSAS